MTYRPPRQPALTPKMAAFVREYLVDLNASAAARRAGYAETNAARYGSELLTRPDIQALVAEGMKKRSVRTEITADNVLRELARIVFFDPRRLFQPDGTPIPINELDDETASAVAGLEIQEVYEGTGEDRVFAGYTRKIKVADKGSAIGLAMRHLGMLKDKLEVEVTDRSARLKAARERLASRRSEGDA